MFGSADVDPDEELELLKQILHANLPSEWVSHSNFLGFFFFFGCLSNCSPFRRCSFKGQLLHLRRRRRRKRKQQSWKRKSWRLSKSLRASLTF